MGLLAGLCDAKQKALQKCKKVLYVMYSEASIRERLKICRNTSGALQVEWMFLITSSSLTLPDKPRVHFEGTSNGEFVGPVAWAPFESPDTWCLPQAIKKQVITKANVISAGGPTYTSDATSDEKKESEKEIALIRSLKKESEPVFFHATPTKLWEEIFHCHNVKAVVDLTPGDGAKALAAIRARVPCVGVTFTGAHRDQLLMQLDKSVLKMYQLEGDKLYEPGFAELLKDSPVEDGLPSEAGKKTPNPAGKRKREGAQSAKKGEKPAVVGQGDGGADDAKKALLARIAALSNGKTPGAGGSDPKGSSNKRQKKDNADEQAEADEGEFDELDEEGGSA